MNKVNYKHIDRNSDELINKLKSNEVIKQIMKSLNLPLDAVKDNVVALSNFLNEQQQCQNCQGLFMCKKKLKGQQLHLEKDLTTNYKCCQYQREENERTDCLKNYLICDLSSDALSNDINKIDLTKERDNYINVVTIVKEWLDKQPNRGIYFYGGLGVGKSYLASCMTNFLAKQDKKVAFVNFPKLAFDIRTNIKNDDYVLATITRMKRAELLVIDDIGAENMTNYIRDDILFTVLDYRMEHKKKTVFTSNSDLDSLNKRLASTKDGVDQTKALRIIERIKTLCAVLPVDGESRRSL